MISVEQRAVGRENNFNLIRMIAATAVLVSHAWPLALGKGAVEPLLVETGYKLGTTSVTIFFAISGFFITKSFDRRVSLSDFALSRVARIYPGLMVALALTAGLLGPIFTRPGLAAYLGDIHSWSYGPINLLLRKHQWCLPGVFLDNPYGCAINGSLWTLYSEVRCYVLVVVAGFLGISRPRFFPILLIVAAGATFIVPQAEGGGVLGAAATLTLPFAIGAATYVYRRYVPVSALLAIGLIALAVLAFGTIFYPVMHALALSYAVLWLGFARIPGIQVYNRLGDYSYGMYIYAFPVEQTWMALNHHWSALQLIGLSLPVTLLLAIASWTWIEEPALRHRHILVARWRLRRMQHQTRRG
jgi:peptidoglycan/LPS O-acetylase OafA/YrhL